MKKNHSGLKILLATLCLLLAAAVALLLFVYFGDRTPGYETIGMQLQDPVVVYGTPAPEATPEPAPESETEPEEPEAAEEPEEGEEPESDAEEPEAEAESEVPAEPTPDEDGFWPCDDKVKVDADSLNVRSGPGTGYEALGSVTDGTVLTRTGYSDEGWTRVVYKGETAYVSSDYVVAE